MKTNIDGMICKKIFFRKKRYITVKKTAYGDNLTLNTVEAPLSIKMYGKSVQETVPGNQLFDANALNLNTNTSLDIYDDGYTIVAKGGTKGGYTDSVYFLELDNLLGKTAYLMADSITGSEAVHLVVTNANGTINYNVINEQTLSKAVIIPTDATRIQARILTNNTSTALGTDKTLTIKGLRLCFDANAKWEPYTGGIPKPIIKSVVVDEVKVCGKNLLKNTATTQTNKGVTFTVNEDGTVVANGTASARAQLLVGTVNLSAGTYIVSQGFKSDSLGAGATGFANYTINGKSTFIDLAGNDQLQFTIDTDTNVRFTAEVRTAGATVTNVIFKPMIRLASITDDTYEPYTENTATLSQPITLHGIGDVMDELTADGVVRKVASEIVTYVREPSITSINTDVDGILKWGYDGFVVNNSALNNTKHESYRNVMSDTFTLVRQTEERTVESGTCLSAYGHTDSLQFRFRLLQSEYPTTADVVDAIVGTKLMYPLAEPITEPLPEADQIALRSLHSYDGVTHVMCDAEMEVEYVESASGDPYVLYKKMYIDGKLVYSAGNPVTYVVDSGVQYTEDVDFDASCLSPKTFTPTKSGWKFAGWREDTAANGSILDSKIMGDEPITLYAVFTADITVTYYNNSSSASSTKGTRYYNNGNVVDPSFKLSQASVSGWSARGWSTGKSGDSSVSYNNNTSFTRDSNCTLYGMYSKTVTLSYNGNGSTGGSTDSHEGTAYRNYKGDVIGASFKLKNNGFSRGGYNFTGWNLGAVGASISIEENTTVYAQWTLALPHTLLSAYDATPSDPHGRFSVSAPTAISGSMGTGYRAWKNQNADGDGDYNFSCSFKFTIYNHTSQAVVAVVSVSEDEYESTWATGGGNYNIAANSSVTVTVSGGGSGNTNPDEYCRVSARCDSIVIKSA